MQATQVPVTLVQIVAPDGMRLHGALELPPAAGASPAGLPLVDAWLCIHGTGSNFYSASTLSGLAPKLLAGGAAVLRGNTRGHDLVSSGPAGLGLQGAAFERVDLAPLDLTAWIDYLVDRGFRRIGLLGHSMGGIKAILTLSTEALLEVTRLVAVSPPRLSYEHFCQMPQADEFLRTMAVAEEHLRAGRGDELLSIRFPIPYYVSASGFVDRYGPEERYNVLRLLHRVQCPTLVTYGSAEMQDPAFRGMSEAVAERKTPANDLRVAVIAGADHVYTGLHDVLAQRIGSWLARGAAAAGGQG
jgi:pimeloyl-ACP methyl ester carboxylesterase